jgi:hypothetical protein
VPKKVRTWGQAAGTLIDGLTDCVKGPARQPVRRKQAARKALALEVLEDRTLLSGTPTATLQLLPAAGQSTPNSKLQAAIQSFSGGKTKTGANQMGAFINEVSPQRGKKIDAALADSLIADAQRIINAVG